MNCESVVENIRALAEGALRGEEKAACMNHIAACQDCADALRGVRAMLVVRDQASVPGSERVFNRVMSKAGSLIIQRIKSRFSVKRVKKSLLILNQRMK